MAIDYSSYLQSGGYTDDDLSEAERLLASGKTGGASGGVKLALDRLTGARSVQPGTGQQGPTYVRGRGFQANPSAYQPFGQGSDVRSTDNAYAVAQADIGKGDPTVDPSAANKRLFGILEQQAATQGRSAEDQLLMEALRARVSGSDVPFNATNINAFKTNAAESGAAAERANASQLQEQMAQRGLSPSDPAYQAAMSRLQTQRQQGNQAAGLQIDMNANQANYAARAQGQQQMQTAVDSRSARERAAATDLAGAYGKVHKSGPAQTIAPRPTVMTRRDGSSIYTDANRRLTGGPRLGGF